MDTDRFDDLLRVLSASSSRRVTLRTLTALAGITSSSRGEAAGKRKKKQCKRCGPCKRCRNGQCVSTCLACQECVNGACQSTCGRCESCSNNQCVAVDCGSPCLKCDPDFGCVSDCGPCERCEHGECVGGCNPCQECVTSPGDPYGNCVHKAGTFVCAPDRCCDNGQACTGGECRTCPEVRDYCTSADVLCGKTAAANPNCYCITSVDGDTTCTSVFVNTNQSADCQSDTDCTGYWSADPDVPGVCIDAPCWYGFAGRPLRKWCVNKGCQDLFASGARASMKMHGLGMRQIEVDWSR